MPIVYNRGEIDKSIESKIIAICCRLIKISVASKSSIIEVRDKLNDRIYKLYVNYDGHRKTDKDTIIIELQAVGRLVINITLYDGDPFTDDTGMLDSYVPGILADMIRSKYIKYMEIRPIYGSGIRFKPFLENITLDTSYRMIEDTYNQFSRCVYDDLRKTLSEYIDDIPSLEELCGIKQST